MNSWYLFLLFQDKKIYTLNIAVVVDTIRREMVTTATEKVDWAMKILSRNTDILTTKLADKIETNGGKEIYFMVVKTGQCLTE